MNFNMEFITNMQQLSSLSHYRLMKIKNISLLDLQVTVIDRKTNCAFNFNIFLTEKTLKAYNDKSMYDTLNKFINKSIFAWDDIRTKPEVAIYVNKKDHLDYFFKDDTDIQDIEMLKLTFFHDLNRFDPLHIIPTNIDKIKWNARVLVVGADSETGYDVSSEQSFGHQINKIITSLDLIRLDQMLILYKNKQYLCTIDTIDYFTNLSKLSRLCVKIKVSGRSDEFLTN